MRKLTTEDLPEQRSLISINETEGADTKIYTGGVLIKEGVWNGCLYDRDILQLAAQSLLGSFVMHGHPAMGTEPGWPELAIGQVVQSKYNPTDLTLNFTAELWREKCPPTILADIEKGVILGVSSGHLGWFETISGTYLEKDYTEVARRIFFNHIAIVPIGACELTDGCFIEKKNNNVRGGVVKLDKRILQGEVPSEVPPEELPASTAALPQVDFKSAEEIQAFIDATATISNPDLQLYNLTAVLMWGFETIGNAFEASVNGDPATAVTNAIEMASWIVDEISAGTPPFAGVGATEAEVATQTLAPKVGKAKLAKVPPKKKVPAKEDPKATEEDVKTPAKMYVYPKIIGGKVEWVETEDPAIVESAKDEFSKSAKTSEGIARDLLMHEIRIRMPNLDDERAKPYGKMPLDVLKTFVGDLMDNDKGGEVAPPAVIIDDGESAEVPPGVSAVLSTGKTSVKVPPPKGGNGKPESYVSMKKKYDEALHRRPKQ